MAGSKDSNQYKSPVDGSKDSNQYNTLRWLAAKIRINTTVSGGWLQRFESIQHSPVASSKDSNQYNSLRWLALKIRINTSLRWMALKIRINTTLSGGWLQRFESIQQSPVAGSKDSNQYNTLRWLTAKIRINTTVSGGWLQRLTRSVKGENFLTSPVSWVTTRREVV